MGTRTALHEHMVQVVPVGVDLVGLLADAVQLVPVHLVSGMFLEECDLALKLPGEVADVLVPVTVRHIQRNRRDVLPAGHGLPSFVHNALGIARFGHRADDRGHRKQPRTGSPDAKLDQCA